MKKLGVVLFALLLAACGTNTSITNSWNAPEAQKPLNKVMIIALMPDKDRELRQNLEQKLAESLSMEGFNTSSAYNQYGPKGFEGLKEKDVLAKLKSSGVDGVLIISLLDKEKEKNYVPGQVSYYPGVVRYNRFWGYYTTYSRRVYSPGYYNTSTKYFLETNLYNVQNNKLMYSAQSETVRSYLSGKAGVGLFESDRIKYEGKADAGEKRSDEVTISPAFLWQAVRLSGWRLSYCSPCLRLSFLHLLLQRW